MLKVDQTLLIENLKKNIKSSYGVLIAISILEILMIVYGLITFNFNEPIRIVYFISYFVLLAASVSGIFLFILLCNLTLYMVNINQCIRYI